MDEELYHAVIKGLDRLGTDLAVVREAYEGNELVLALVTLHDMEVGVETLLRSILSQFLHDHPSVPRSLQSVPEIIASVTTFSQEFSTAIQVASMALGLRLEQEGVRYLDESSD